MNEQDFRKYLQLQVEKYRSEYSLTEGKAFGLWYAVDSLGFEEDEAYEAVSYDGANDKDIDFFFIDHEAERILVGQLKFNFKGKYKGTKPELLGLIHTTDWLKDPESLARDGRKDIAAAASDYLEAVRNGFSVEYLYVYCGPARKDVDDAARQFNVTEAGNVPSRSCRVVNLPTLIAEHSERIDQSTRIAKETLTCSKRHFKEKGSFGEALITTITGKQLQDFYLSHGDRLFDRNIRLFLGARKGGVNAGIRDTIDSVKDRCNFWAYNNGVTFICDHYELNAAIKLTLYNFSIVNGCQTTVTIGNSSPSAVKDVRVLARFISAPEAAIDSIIRFTNSQNPIRVWDLSAQDKLQKRLKKELANLPQPFLYVLRKGETRQLSATDREKFKRNGKGAILTIPRDRNAQYLAAFRGLPAIAYKDKGKVFSTFYEQVFPAQIRTEEIALVWQAGSVATELVKKELEKAVQEDNQQRVAILKRGAKFFVLAAMAIILHERNGNTFLNKLKPEVAVSKATEARLRNYAQVALEWYIEGMQELVDAGTEVSTLVRSQEWWTKLRQKLISKWRVYSLAKKVVQESLPVI